IGDRGEQDRGVHDGLDGGLRGRRGDRQDEVLLVAGELAGDGGSGRLVGLCVLLVVGHGLALDVAVVRQRLLEPFASRDGCETIWVMPISTDSGAPSAASPSDGAAPPHAETSRVVASRPAPRPNMVERFFTVFLSNVHHVPVVRHTSALLPLPGAAVAVRHTRQRRRRRKMWQVIPAESVLKILPVNGVTLSNQTRGVRTTI